MVAIARVSGTLARVGAAVVGAVALLMVVVVWFEEAFIYFPSRGDVGTPAATVTRSF